MRGSTAGLAESMIASPHTIHATFLVFLDIIFSSIIAAPIIINYWRSTWNLMGYFLYPNDPLLSALGSCALATFGHFAFSYYQEKLNKTFHPDKHRITFLLCSRLYTILYGIVCVNGWRGGWMLMDQYVPLTVAMLSAITIVSAILLAMCKGLRNISSAPFAISTDHSKDYFVVPTMFKSSATQEPGFYFIDCAFSVIIIGTLVVFVWRGLWVLCDLLIYPNQPSLSAWGSLAIGYGFVAVTFAMQSLMKWACDRLEGWKRLAAADIFLTFSFIGTINVWRGLWQLLDLYVLFEDRFVNDLVSHVTSFVLLLLLNCANSILVRGVYIDAEEPGGQCVIFPIYYVRLYFQKERARKQKRVLDITEKAEREIFLEKDSPTNGATTNNKSSAKAIEMTAMLNNRNEINTKETFINGGVEHIIPQ